MSVGYSLAPEHKFPEGLEDAYAATLWVSEHAVDFGADPSCIAVAGEHPVTVHIASKQTMLFSSTTWLNMQQAWLGVQNSAVRHERFWA